MKLQKVKGSTSQILTVFIQDSSATNGSGLGSLDENSVIVGGYVRTGSTGVALAVDENVTTEGTYQAPSAAGKVRIGTPANMIAGVYELHFHNDLFAAGSDGIVISLSGASNMAPLLIEIQLTGIDLDDATPAVDVTHWLGQACAAVSVNGVPEVDLTHISGAAASLATEFEADLKKIDGDVQSMTDLKDFADTGYDPATHKVQGVVLSDTATDVTNEVSADTVKISGDTDAATRLSKSAGSILPGTVDTVVNGHTPTTTEFQADDITEATADHFKGRVIIFTSGNLQYQACTISGYTQVGGIGQFTVTTLTEAPANNNTFVIV